MFVRGAAAAAVVVGSTTATAAAGGLKGTTRHACWSAVLQSINARLRLSRPPTVYPTASSALLHLSHCRHNHHLSTARGFSTTRVSLLDVVETAHPPSLLTNIPVLGISKPSKKKATSRQQPQPQQKKEEDLSIEIGASKAKKRKLQKKKSKEAKVARNTAEKGLFEATGLKELKAKTTTKTATITTTAAPTVKQKRKKIPSPSLRTSVLFVKEKPKMSDPFQATPSPYTSYAIVTNLRRLPYKHKTITNTQQHVLAKYFDLEPFFTQSGHHRWEIYYDTDPNGKPVLLVTLKQAWAFLDYVQRETGIEVPRHPKSNYCYRKKEVKPGETLQEPQRVATVGTKAEWEEVMVQWAAGTTGRGGESALTAEEREARKKRQKERQEMKRTGYSLQVDRARKLLGFSTETVTQEVILKEWSAKEGEEGAIKVTTEGFERIEITTSTNKKKAESEFEDIPFFVCVDCESWELNHNAITEIGIATLDMCALPPSSTRPTYEAIAALMKYRHIRVREHLRKRNGKFVPDAADLFDFGKTEIFSLAGLPKVLAEAFTPPPLPSSSTSLEGTGKRKPRRTIAFVGHDAAADIRYLAQCNFDSRLAVREALAKLDSDDGITNNGREMEIFDTADMYKSITGESNTKGLGKMLVELGLDPWNLHNAGNDAAYTLKGFVKMCEGMETGAGSTKTGEAKAGTEEGGVKI